MNTSFIDYGSAEWQQARLIRYELFFKPRNLPMSILDDSYDKHAFHCAIKHDGQVVAYGRLHAEERTAYISQMVVARAWQRQGLGGIVLSSLVEKAKEQGYAGIMLNARVSVLEFYKKLGFKEIGNVFTSTATKIPHMQMVLWLDKNQP